MTVPAAVWEEGTAMDVREDSRRRYHRCHRAAKSLDRDGDAARRIPPGAPAPNRRRGDKAATSGEEHEVDLDAERGRQGGKPATAKEPARVGRASGGAALLPGTPQGRPARSGPLSPPTAGSSMMRRRRWCALFICYSAELPQTPVAGVREELPIVTASGARSRGGTGASFGIPRLSACRPGSAALAVACSRGCPSSIVGAQMATTSSLGTRRYAARGSRVMGGRSRRR
jgi:hypothetical protein